MYFVCEKDKDLAAGRGAGGNCTMLWTELLETNIATIPHPRLPEPTHTHIPELV